MPTMAAEAHLTFEHDEFTMKPTLDENGRLILREDYRISSQLRGEDLPLPEGELISAMRKTKTGRCEKPPLYHQL